MKKVLDEPYVFQFTVNPEKGMKDNLVIFVKSKDPDAALYAAACVRAILEQRFAKSSIEVLILP